MEQHSPTRAVCFEWDEIENDLVQKKTIRCLLTLLVHSIRIGRYIAESRLGRRSRWKIRASRPENIA